MKARRRALAWFAVAGAQGVLTLLASLLPPLPPHSAPTPFRAAVAPLVEPLVGAFVVRDAHASVSIAVLLDDLVRDTKLVAVFVPLEQRAVWENGRIYTYTRLKVDTPVDGKLDSPDIWVRTMGGVVGEIGQSVSGEPALTVGKPSMLFLRPGPIGVYEVTARAQGQFPIVKADDGTLKLLRSPDVGAVLLPRHLEKLATAPGTAAPPSSGTVAPSTKASPRASGSSTGSAAVLTPAIARMLAAHVLVDKPLKDAIREVREAWKRVHAN